MSYRIVSPLLLAGAAITAFSLPAHADIAMLKQIEQSFIQLHENVGPSVVNIEIRGTGEEEAPGMDDLFHFFGVPNPNQGGPQEPQQAPRTQATGSGFIYNAEGYIITNNHVVADADTISVRLSNGKEYEAKTIGTDPDTDIAVIKIEPDEPLTPAKLGDSDALKVGQFAIAIGSPRQLEGTVSFGHISALGREGLDGLRVQGLRFQNLVQTDAAINLGNSGGPLCNIDGEVVGINTAIVWGANSIGFAIPINSAKEIVPQLISDGHVTRGYLGVGIDDVSSFADAVSLPDNSGAFVKEVRPDTPAERAKLQTYDVIRKINGEPVANASDLVRRISGFKPGATVKLEVWRDGKAIDVDVELSEWEPEAEVAVATGGDVLGMQLRALNPDMIDRLGLEPDTKGVLISNVKPGTPAEEANLMPGDIIIEIAQKPVGTPAELRDAVEKEGKPGKSLLIRFLRGNREADITVLRVPKE
jgi:serine protease Do